MKIKFKFAEVELMFKYAQLDRPLVAGCSIGHKSRPLHVSRWDMGQTKKSKYTSNIYFPQRWFLSFYFDTATVTYFAHSNDDMTMQTIPNPNTIHHDICTRPPLPASPLPIPPIPHSVYLCF